jgi:hypothetical protein
VARIEELLQCDNLVQETGLFVRSLIPAGALAK